MQSTVTSTQSPRTGLSDHAVSDSLGLWEPKRTLTLEAARQHSAHIAMLRKGLILTSAALVAFVAWQFINQPPGFDLVDNPDETVRMTDPKYSGRTSDDLPYYLTATQAVRNAASSTTVNLTAPILNFYRTIGVEPSKVTAVNGIYDDVDNILNLTDTVRLGTDDGYSCKTSESKIFTKNKLISGNAHIACNGSFGDVNGNSYTISEDYTVYTFADGMSAIITRDANAKKGESFGFDGNGPINVQAQTATYKKAITTLSGQVAVNQGASRVTSDNMVIYRAEVDKTARDEADKSLKLGAITEIDATGNFVYTAPQRRLTGKRGVYDREENIITVTGDVLLKQDDGTMVTGEKLVYDLTEKRARVGPQCTGPNCGGRVNFEIQNQKN